MILLVFQVAAFNRNAPIKNAVHSVTLQATQATFAPEATQDYIHVRTDFGDNPK